MSVLAATHRVGSGGLVFGLVFVLIVLIPAGRILRRTGYSPWYCLLLLIPLVNIVMIFVFAFSTWPVDRGLQGYRQGGPGGAPGGFPEPPWPGRPQQGYVPGGPQGPAQGWPSPGTNVPPPPPGTYVPPPVPPSPVPPPPPSYPAPPPAWPGGPTPPDA